MADFDIRTDFFDKMNSNVDITLKINGISFPEISDYSFYFAKSYLTDVKRSANGSVDLDNYATITTARLRINFKFMPIETYRVIMDLIQTYNKFVVECYDPVSDSVVTKEMYFYPKDFPQIYQQNLETLAVRDESFELVGTNNDNENISITYHSNNGNNDTSVVSTQYGSGFVIGTYDSEGGQDNPFGYTRSGYKLYCYNTKSDGSGINLFENDSVKFVTDRDIYAVWKPENQYVMSFDYNGATSGTSETSRNITQGQTISNLPVPIKTNYTFVGWYLYDGVTQVQNGDTYTYNENKTLYAKFE